MHNADQPLDQPGPPATSWHTLALGVALCVFGLLLWLGVAWLVLVSIPGAARLFADFHMAIPFSADLLIRFRWAIPVLAVVSLAVCIYSRRPWAWLWLLIVLPAFISTAVIVILYVPITALMNGLQGNNAGWWGHLL
jgi:hypothetical protein